MRIAEILRETLDEKIAVNENTDDNTITITRPNGTAIVLRPISISPVK